MNALSVFSFQENHPVRVQILAGEPWFCLKDVCDVLNIANSRRVASEVLDQNGVRKTYIIDSMGREQEAAFVNEPNLYRVIFRSNKPEARQFQNWVFNEVLPAIRKNGEYAFVEPEPKSAGEPLNWRQQEELRGLVNDIAQSFRYRNAWISGVWLALRRACRNPSPDKITVDDLPAIAAELRRILKAAETALDNMRAYEREFLREVVRGGQQSMSHGELSIMDIGTEREKVLPAHFELAIEKLERLSTKLTSSAIAEK